MNTCELKMGSILFTTTDRQVSIAWYIDVSIYAWEK